MGTFASILSPSGFELERAGAHQRYLPGGDSWRNSRSYVWFLVSPSVGVPAAGRFVGEPSRVVLGTGVAFGLVQARAVSHANSAETLEWKVPQGTR